jgi:hypothetical protein
LSIQAALDAVDPVGLLPLVDGPAATALSTLLADERLAAGDKPTAMGTRLRGSMAGKCARAMGFEIIGYRPDLDFETATLVAFRTGSDLHDMVQAALIAHLGAAIEVACTWMPELDLSIAIDAVYRAERWTTATEIKSMQPFAFDLATGVRKRAELPGPKAEHLLQAGLGALAPAINATELHMIYVDKAAGRLAEWLIGIDDELPHLGGITVRDMVAAEVVRMRGILARIDAGELPRPVVPGHGLVTDPPARDAKGQPWQCRYCRYQPTCASLGPDVIPLSNLSTGT